MGAAWARLTDRSLPSMRTDLYFCENILFGANCKKVLFCPTAVGCILRDYDPNDFAGGRPLYSVAKTTSYSEFVPRYEIRVIGLPGNSLVGVLDKEETHLRTKLGEFIRVQHWKVRYNSLLMSHDGKARPSQTHSLHLVIAKQAKIDISRNEYGDIMVHSETERWHETFSTDLRGFEMSLEESHFTNDQAMDKVNIYWKGVRIGSAKKQGFAGAFGGTSYARPYIGLELAQTLESTKKGLAPGSMRSLGSFASENTHVLVAEALEKLLSSDRLRAVLACLAWSEQTVDIPRDETQSFIEAMRAHPAAPESAKNKRMPASWSTSDVQRHLQVESIAWVHLRDWEETSKQIKHAKAVDASADEGPQEEAEVVNNGPPVDPNDPLFV